MKHEPRHRQGDGAVQATELRIELAEPANEAAHLQLLLRERLARLSLAAPTLELELLCSELAPGAAPNAELFPTQQSERAGLTRLLERLRARLGDEQVLQLQPVADHRPERSSRNVAALTGMALPAAVAGSAVLPLVRPVWLLPEALPLAERGALPLFEGRALQLLAGPERIEAGWWDGALATRDYFIAQAADSSLVWVYRARLPPTEAAPVQWFLQGRFG